MHTAYTCIIEHVKSFAGYDALLIFWIPLYSKQQAASSKKIPLYIDDTHNTQHTHTHQTIMIVEILAGIAVGLIAWTVYTVVTRFFLKQSIFLHLQVLSETRPVVGDLTALQKAAQKLSSYTDEDDLIYVWGQKTQQDGTLLKVGNDLVLCETPDNKYSLWARKTLPDQDLRTILKTRKKGKFLTDSFLFVQYMQKIEEALPIPNIIQEGEYHICCRTYCNQEEEWGIMCNRWGIENLLMMPVSVGAVRVEKSGKCTLVDRGLLFGCVPIVIHWYGHYIVVDGVIEWTSSTMQLGWKRFERPSADVEKMKNWKVLVPPGDKTGDIIVFERQGKGRSLAAKQSIFMQ
jgi:hypothetical protein